MTRAFSVIAMIVALLVIGRRPASAAPAWWKRAVFYEIYPRSFADSNDDGVGDLAGVASKLDYLQALGIDAIWITPCYPSPQEDFGYDVADYKAIDPMYGTLEDFDRLQAQAKKRGIRIIMDFVMNHTSDRHPWFLSSRSSKSSPYRDWYVWRDGKGPGRPPNNWLSTFGGPAWTFDAKTGQWYYHYFYVGQPDLNWRNPAVKKAMFDVTRFWYTRGVSGFRLDAVDTLFEDPRLRDNPVHPGKNEYGDPIEDDLYNDKLPEVHGVLRDLRKVADQYGAVLVGETWTDDVQELKRYYGPRDDEIQLPMDFMFAMSDDMTLAKQPVSAPLFRKRIAAIEVSGEWPVFVIGNHDRPRSYDRFGDGKHDDAIAKLMAGMYLTLRGTPIMYYGEEIGMTTTDPKRKADVKDPIGAAGWPKVKGRDGERTPMQWSAAPNAGFSRAKPWLPVPASYKTRNVAVEEGDPGSILSFYKKLLALRHESAALQDGAYLPLDKDDPDALSYVRRYENEAVLVALNMSPMRKRLTLALPSGLSAKGARTLLATEKDSALTGSSELSLEPFGVYIARLSK